MEDPVSGDDVELMWVKGSGGDLGTLTADGLAALRVDRLRGLKEVYRGEEHEDEMHELLDYCRFGQGGAAPSIDTSMHGLLRVRARRSSPPRRRHRAGRRRRRRGADQAVLRRGGGLGPVAAPRVRARAADRALHESTPRPEGRGPRRPRPDHVGPDLARMRAQLAGPDPPGRRSSSRSAGQAGSVGTAPPGFEPLAEPERRRRAAATGARCSAGCASTDRPVVGHWFDSDARARLHRPGGRAPGGAARDLVPRPLHPHQGAAAAARPAATDAPLEDQIDAAPGAARASTGPSTGLLPAVRRRRDAADAGGRPGHRPRPRRRHVQLRRRQPDRPGRRRVLRQRDQRDPGRRGRSPPTRRSPRPRSSASSTGCWRRRSCAAARRPKPLTGKVALVTGRGLRHRAGHRRCVCARRAPPWSSPTSTSRRPAPTAEEIGAGDHAMAVQADVTDEAGGPGGDRRDASPASAASTSSSTTPGCRSPRRCSRPPRRTGTASTT